MPKGSFSCARMRNYAGGTVTIRELLKLGFQCRTLIAEKENGGKIPVLENSSRKNWGSVHPECGIMLESLSGADKFAAPVQ